MTARKSRNRTRAGRFVCLSVLAARFMAAQSAAPAGRPAPMDRQKEIAMALSACPANIADRAAVYVLESSGYRKIRESGNGFTAIVQHSMLTTQEPQCLDTEGTRTFLPRMLKVAELRAQGKGAEEIKRLVADAFAKGELQPPTRPGITYMLSPDNRVPDTKGGIEVFPPHVMFYAPYITNADIGSAGQDGAGPAFVAGPGSPYALIIVPVAGSGEGHTHPQEQER